MVDSFDDMDLREELLRGIYAYGFEKPSAIQARAILPSCTGRDVIAQAQSGTGKTATFSIAVLQQLDINLKQCQALVLAPTRELATQVGNTISVKNECYVLWCVPCVYKGYPKDKTFWLFEIILGWTDGPIWILNGVKAEISEADDIFGWTRHVTPQTWEPATCTGMGTVERLMYRTYLTLLFGVMIIVIIVEW